jgi:hypothetical protein
MAGSTWHRTFADRGCRGPTPEPAERQLAARAVERALGAVLFWLLEMCVADLPWAEVAARFGIDRRTARAWCAGAIAGLARVV